MAQTEIKRKIKKMKIIEFYYRHGTYYKKKKQNQLF